MTSTPSCREAALPLQSRLFTLVNVLMLVSGCIPVTDRIIPGPMVRLERATHETGVIQASVQAHPDNQGWTVTVVQPVTREVHVMRSVQVERHYYYLNPLTLPAGLFACPSSVWGWAFSILTPLAPAEKRRQLLDFTVEACLLALMIARTNPEITAEHMAVEKRLEPDTIPVAEGRVTLAWSGPEQIELSYPIDVDGRAVIRLSHLGTSLQNAGYGLHHLPEATVTFSVWHKNQVQVKWPLEITPATIHAALRHHQPAIASAERWPRPLVLKVRFHGSSPVNLRLEERLTRLAITHGVPLITSEEAQSFLRHELEQTLTGMTDDHSTPSPGHWLAPTVLLGVRTHETAAHALISLQCHNIQTGEVLAHIEVPASPNGLGLAIDVALAKLDDALRHLVTPQRYSKKEIQ